VEEPRKYYITGKEVRGPRRTGRISRRERQTDHRKPA
jgi:hypothetical protein